MEINLFTREAVTLVGLTGELDSGSAPQAEQTLKPLAQEAATLILDMSGVSFMSSAGIRVLQITSRASRASGGTFLLAGLSPVLQNVLQQTGLLALFRCFPDSDAALLFLGVAPSSEPAQTDAPSLTPALEQRVQATLLRGSNMATLNFSRTPYSANREIRQHIREIASSLGASAKTLDELLLAVDEAVTNIVLHGYRGQESGSIQIETAREGHDLIVRLIDTASPFDPTEVEPPDLTLPPEARPLGGIGIHLMRQNVDRISHEVTEDGGNALTLVKCSVLP